VGEPADSAVLSAGLQSQDTEGLWHNHALGGVVWWWDTLEDLKTLQSSLPAGCLVCNHASDGLVEDAGWGTEVERTTGLVETGGLSEVGVILDFIEYPSQQKFPDPSFLLSPDMPHLLCHESIVPSLTLRSVQIVIPGAR